MNIRRSYVVASLIVVIGLVGVGVFYARTERGPIYTFDDARDMKDVLDLMQLERYWLFANEDSSPEFMLKHRAPSTDIRYVGRLIIKVYRENNKFVGFTAYYMKTPDLGFLLFIAVNPEYRGKDKGYAERLMRYALGELKKMGAQQVQLYVRVDNLRGQGMYKRVGYRELYRDDTGIGMYMGYDVK